ncbi:MAG: S41 family peptidase [Turicibacter sp.]|nr:S41 family peptidase [Turicibacter sp.]
MNHKIKLFVSFLLGVALTGAVAIFFVFNQARTIVSPSNAGTIDAVEDVFNRLRSLHYFYEGDDQQLINGAIEGMVNALGDPHSSFFTLDEFDNFSSGLRDSFVGIGAEVTSVNGYTMIVNPFPGSPAEEAGLMPNDLVITIDGENVVGMPLNEVIGNIRGPEGTEVTMGIRRGGSAELIYLVPVRGVIPQESVRSELKMVDEVPIGYVQILSFGESTAAEFFAAISDLESQGIEGLVVDVRNNSGGYLRAVVDMLDYLLPEGEVITSVVNREGRGETFMSSGESPGKTYPIVTLINGGSASASEIFAAAMQEAARQEVVGLTSFGKGTVQVTIPLDAAHMLKITTQVWRTSDGNWINETGVEPSVVVEDPEFYFFSQVIVEDGNEITFDTVSPVVMNAQNILQLMGYLEDRNDGYFDQATVDSVRAFQESQGLEVTGTLNSETATALSLALREKARDPQFDSQLQAALQIAAGN